MNNKTWSQNYHRDVTKSTYSLVFRKILPPELLKIHYVPSHLANFPNISHLHSVTPPPPLQNPGYATAKISINIERISSIVDTPVVDSY